MKNQLRKVQNAAAGFVSNKYAQIKDVLELKLLTIEENIKTDIFVQSFTWPTISKTFTSTTKANECKSTKKQQQFNFDWWKSLKTQRTS